MDENLLGWWLSERQCDSGGLNGRPEKQADVCYSWWILSSLSILGRVSPCVVLAPHSIASVLHLPTTSYQVSWIDCDKLAGFILQAQDADEGGISDRPGNMPDIFHTFFGISGLLLLGYFGGSKSDGDSGNDKSKRFIAIDPTYALPVNVVQRLGLRSQVLHDVNIK